MLHNQINKLSDPTLSVVSDDGVSRSLASLLSAVEGSCSILTLEGAVTLSKTGDTPAFPELKKDYYNSFDDMTGMSVFDLMKAGKLCDFYAHVFERYRERENLYVNFMYKDHTPIYDRHCLVTLSPLVVNHRIVGVMHQTILTRHRRRRHEPMYDASNRIDDYDVGTNQCVLNLCTLCNNVCESNEWMSIDEYLASNDSETARLCNTTCPTCNDSLYQRLTDQHIDWESRRESF